MVTPRLTAEQFSTWELSQRPVTAVSNTELYDRWASVYDSDGNILQAIDDQELPALLTTFFLLLPPAAKITELGCGTARNTLKVLQPPFASQIGGLTCLDLSEKMLAVAKQRVASNPSSDSSSFIKPIFKRFDVLNDTIPDDSTGADGLVSTLVLEHLPLKVFFLAARKMLKTGGALLLTNMHAEMGSVSRAGYLDVETGVKVTGTSYTYDIAEVVAEAERQGFRIVGEMKERGVKEEDLEAIGVRGRKWLGVRVWFGGLFRLEG